MSTPVSDRIAIQDIGPLLNRAALLPTVVMWNRLEGRPRRADFDRALRAELRDALWFLTRQWQTGEFRGDDAGSPVHARMLATVSALQRFRAGDGEAAAIDHELPLETTVERRRIPFRAANQPLALDVRLLMGRHWLAMVKAVGDFKAAYIARHPVTRPNPALRSEAARCAHLGVWQRFAALAGRAMDGYLLYRHLVDDATHRASDGVAMTPTEQTAIDALGGEFVAWFDALYSQPVADNDAWQPSQLEYRFQLSAAPDERVLTADEYHHDRVDWFNLDHDPAAAPLTNEGESPAPVAGVTQISRAFFPTALQFEGMPNTRWWTFEDGKTNFGDVAPDTNELGKLLLMEFGLVYANDWFLVPLTVPAGSIVDVRGLAVTNVFGERTWITPAGKGPDDAWQSWRMFSLSTRGDAAAADTSLVMLPTVGHALDGKPLEDVALVRDEIANMVWGIENAVPLPDGRPRAGREAALETRAFHERLVGAGSLPPITWRAPVRYEIMNQIPEHWIPFIPVHIEGDDREVQLQRASLPRLIEGDATTPEKVKPRTTLLRHGLDAAIAAAYFVHEEEVPRAGIQVTQGFQRARWYGGRIVTWFGARKAIGRGSGASRLAFDQLRPTSRK